MEHAHPLAASRQITLTLEEGPTPTRLLGDLLGDSHLLARAIENLIDNGICYT